MSTYSGGTSGDHDMLVRVIEIMSGERCHERNHKGDSSHKETDPVGLDHGRDTDEYGVPSPRR